LSEESPGGGLDWRPVPDPTVLTTDQILRAVQSERDYVDGQIAVLVERLGGIDRATKLLDETVHRVPTDIQKEIAHLTGLVDEKFRSIDVQFSERDTRSERESRDNKVAVDAAFAAQKEAAAKQDESNAKAIDKSEAATTETINKLNELFRSDSKSLADKIDDLKARLTAVESIRIGGIQSESERHASIGSTTAILMVVIGVLTILVIAALSTHGFTA